MSLVYDFSDWSFQSRVYLALLIAFVGGFLLGLITPLIFKETKVNEEISQLKSRLEKLENQKK